MRKKFLSALICTMVLSASATPVVFASEGTTSSIQAGTSSTWQNVTSPTKTWTNSNGTKTVYEQSNFAVSPDSDLSGYEVSIVQTSKVKLKGDNKTYSLTSGC